MEIWLKGYFGEGKCAIVDPVDYERLNKYSWSYKEGYAIAYIGGKEVRMHRLVLGTRDSNLVVDHINRDRLDNRAGNLREFTPVENANNRSNNTLVEAFGETKTIADWSRDSRCGVKYSVLRERIRRGFPEELAILAGQ